MTGQPLELDRGLERIVLEHRCSRVVRADVYGEYELRHRKMVPRDSRRIPVPGIASRYLSAGTRIPSPSRGGAPKRGAGIGGTAEQGPHLWGCDRGADRGRVVLTPIPCASPRSDPQRGSSSARRRAPVSGDATVEAQLNGVSRSRRPARLNVVASCASMFHPGRHPLQQPSCRYSQVIPRGAAVRYFRDYRRSYN